MADLQIISTQNRPSSASEGRGTTAANWKDMQAFFWPEVLGVTSPTMAYVFENFLSTNTGEVANGNSYTIVECFVQIGTAVRQMTFGGNNSITIANNSVDIVTDELDLMSAFGFIPQKGDQYWIKGIAQVTTPGTTTGKLPFTARSVSDIAGSQASWFSSGTYTGATVTDVISAGLTPGAYTLSVGAFDVRQSGVCPKTIGRPSVNVPILAALGDSIEEGAGDNAAAGIHGRGFIQRMARDATATAASLIPCMNLGRTGNTVDNVQGVNNRKWENYIKYCPNGSLWVGNYGTNDIGSAGLGDLPTIQTKIIALINTLKAANSTFKIAWMLLMPRTNSASTNWTSSADQTPFTNWAQGEKGDQQNAWLVSQVGTNLDGVIDTSAVRDQSRPEVWITNGTNDYPTTDGTHPAVVTTELAAVAGRITRANLLAVATDIIDEGPTTRGVTIRGITSRL